MKTFLFLVLFSIASSAGAQNAILKGPSAFDGTNLTNISIAAIQTNGFTPGTQWALTNQNGVLVPSQAGTVTSFVADTAGVIAMVATATTTPTVTFSANMQKLNTNNGVNLTNLPIASITGGSDGQMTQLSGQAIAASTTFQQPFSATDFIRGGVTLVTNSFKVANAGTYLINYNSFLTTANTTVGAPVVFTIYKNGVGIESGQSGTVAASFYVGASCGSAGSSINCISQLSANDVISFWVTQYNSGPMTNNTVSANIAQLP